MTRPRRAALALFVIVPLALAMVGVVRADPPPNRTLDYTILRNGDPIGTHHVVFARQGERFTVTHRIDIRVILTVSP